MYLIKMQSLAPVSYVSAGRFESEGGWTHSRRNLDTGVLIIGLKGTLYIQESEHQFEVKPGDVLYLLPGVTHFGYYPCPEPLSYFWCHFRLNVPYAFEEEDSFFLRNQGQIPKSGVEFINQNKTMLLPLYHNYENTDEIKVIFNELLGVVSDEEYVQAIADNYLNIILLRLSAKYLYDYGVSHTVESNRRLSAILEWIRVNYDKDISSSDIAEHFNYNENYLSRLIRNKTGLGLQKYIAAKKIEKAKEILLDSDSSVKEVAFCLGFTDDKYFMRVFKNFQGITPTQFRNMHPHVHTNKK